MCSKFLLEHFLKLARPLCKGERSRIPAFPPACGEVFLLLCSRPGACNTQHPYREYRLWLWNASASTFELATEAFIYSFGCFSFASIVCCYQSFFKEFRKSSEGLHWGHGSLSGEDQFGIIFAHNPTERTWFTENPSPVQQKGRLKSQEAVNKGCVLVTYFLNIFPKFWCFMSQIKFQEFCEGCLACVRLWLMELALSGLWTVGGT